MSFEKLWDIDRGDELRNRTWWWWWWIFFLENKEDPAKPKQLMTLWGTRNCKKITVDDYVWLHTKENVEAHDGTEFQGIAAAWFFDGKEMHDPWYVDNGWMHIAGNANEGSLSLEHENMYRFAGKDGKYNVRVKRGDLGFDLSMTQNPKARELGGVIKTGKRYLKHLGYQMYKIRNLNAKGTISIGGSEEKVRGTTYFQNVRINSPTSPWYWAVFHAENGAFIDYFLPHIGLPMFRRSINHKSILDRGEKVLSKGFDFYNPEQDRFCKIKRIIMTKTYNERDLPVFKLDGKEEGKEVSITMECYSRATWRIQQPLLHFLNTRLFYNEYPAVITSFLYKDGEGEVTLKQLGRTVGNCEHAWGIV